MAKAMSAHQPNFLPYLGFFDKMKAVCEIGEGRGIFVVREDCQYVGSDFHSRNKIRINEGWVWINVPVEKRPAPISEIRIKKDARIKNAPWNKYHLRLIEANYKKAPFFEKHFSGLSEIYNEPGDSLLDFNMRIIVYLSKCFGIKAKFVMFSELPENTETGNPSKTLANIAKALGADIYLSGDGGREYMDMDAFKGIEVRFQNYKHPAYPQRFFGFEPYLSAIDALFNVGRLLSSGESILKEDREKEGIKKGDGQKEDREKEGIKKGDGPKEGIKCP
jgi:hypothetical protein